MARRKSRLEIAATMEMIRTLNPDEKIRFARYLESPFFFRQTTLGDLFEYLRNRKEEAAEEVSLDSLFGRLYPEEKSSSAAFKKKKMINTLSDLNHAVMRFIAECAFANDPIQQQYYVVQRFTQQIGHPKISRKALKVYDTLIKRERDGFKKHLARYLYQDLEFFSPLNNPYAARHSDGAMGKMTEDLEIAFLYARLNLVCNMVYRQNVVAAKPTEKPRRKGSPTDQKSAPGDEPAHNLEEDIADVTKLVEKYPREKYPEFHLYMKLINLGRQIGDQDLLMDAFDNLKSIYKQAGDTLARQFLLFLTNYCTRSFKNVSLKFLEFKMEIIDWGAEYGILFFSIGRQQAVEMDRIKLEQEISFQEDLFLDIALTLLGTGGKEAQGLEFIERQFEKLPKQVQENARYLCKAYYFFQTAQFGEVLYCLHRVDSRQLKYAVRFHSLRVRSVYELYATGKTSLEQMEAALATIRQHFHRNNLDVSDTERKQYQNLRACIQKMVNYRKNLRSRKKPVSAKLLEEIKTKMPANYSWVKKKIEELK
ncbi:MAG TPA: hypothetical protein PKE06_24330 [Flavilitoribacter sp.]|nr:hypothetical protein [Flavilitoribacter sp.]HMQ88180.1 hypothetical protein [Flavilitoribacter sp.]